MLTIGLFGTCGGSTWREDFKVKYIEEGIPYFDPQKADWKPEDAEIEARHLAKDKIILFPLTSETYALGSLAEIGFSILNAISLDDRRDFVILIANDLDEKCDDPALRKESLRGRALVKQHLAKLRLSNLYLVETLDEMLDISVQLYRAAELKEPYEKYNPHRIIE